jgi:lipopolysaccharide biosynthesis protein
MKRLAIYAHFDAGNVVKRCVEFQLARLREQCDEIWFVSTSRLPDEELSKLQAHCARVTLRENVGYDFAMWRYELLRAPIDQWDELVLTNSSVFGPVFPLGDAFARMAPVVCDFWGMTDTPDPMWHLQSYFLVFRAPALRHAAFRQFWESVLPYRTKRQLILSYELGLSTFLVEQGLRPAAFAPFRELSEIPPKWPWSKRQFLPNMNPSIHLPFPLLERRMPFVKVEIFRDNTANAPLSTLRRAIKAAGYDTTMLEYDQR